MATKGDIAPECERQSDSCAGVYQRYVFRSRPLGAIERANAAPPGRDFAHKKSDDLVFSRALSSIKSRTNFGGGPFSGFSRPQAFFGSPPKFDKTVAVDQSHRDDCIPIARAQELLIHTSLSVVEAAEAVGNPDVTYFTHVFLEEVGFLPAQWQRGQLR